jgi:tRNA threonylcarbamoyl adenosine modification protein (Sua5/YciO/YrdC/YwlC family)
MTKSNGLHHDPLIVTLSSLVTKKHTALAASFLKKGDVVATPTDTIYGLAALATDNKAIRKIYEIKGRDENKPIAICVAEVDDVYKWGQVTIPRDLLVSLFPGPVTLCFNRSPALNPELNPGVPVIGIRIPDHSFIREVCRATQLPLALTSANISSSKSTLAIEEFTQLYGHLSAIFDGGRLGLTEQSRLGSTVVDLSNPGCYKIIREGSAHAKTVEKLELFDLKDHGASS